MLLVSSLHMLLRITERSVSTSVPSRCSWSPWAIMLFYGWSAIKRNAFLAESANACAQWMWMLPIIPGNGKMVQSAFFAWNALRTVPRERFKDCQWWNMGNPGTGTAAWREFCVHHQWRENDVCVSGRTVINKMEDSIIVASITTEEEKLLLYFRQLNELGKRLLMKQAQWYSEHEELAEKIIPIKRYLCK